MRSAFRCIWIFRLWRSMQYWSSDVAIYFSLYIYIYEAVASFSGFFYRDFSFHSNIFHANIWSDPHVCYTLNLDVSIYNCAFQTVPHQCQVSTKFPDDKHHNGNIIRYREVSKSPRKTVSTAAVLPTLFNFPGKPLKLISSNHTWLTYGCGKRSLSYQSGMQFTLSPQ